METKQNKSVLLPITEPVYSTYHHQGNGSAILAENPSIRNWYYNCAVLLRCSRRFLYGETSPFVSVEKSGTDDNPYLEKIRIPMRCLGSDMHRIIRRFLNEGYYVEYRGIDDYYVKGKSWYHQRHFLHDGLICGYDQSEKTYTLFAYDQTWKYRIFKTPQRCIEKGRKSGFAKDEVSSICALRPMKENVSLCPKQICEYLREYIESTVEVYPPYRGEVARGISVYDYVAAYLQMLAVGQISHEHIDRRVFRMLWEHKKVMLARLRAVETALGLECVVSEKYIDIVREADVLRMLYASHCVKRRDSLLKLLCDRLLALRQAEVLLLTRFIDAVKGEISA